MAFLGKSRNPDFLYNASRDKITFAKYLRKHLTPSEKALWKWLKGSNICGVRFRRQHPVGRFVADFYSHEIRLVIEVDGPIHNRLDRKEYDRNRDAEMQRLGIKVIRITNDDLKYHWSKVKKRIRDEVLIQLKIVGVI